MVLKVEHVFLYRWGHSDVDSSLIGWHKMSVAHKWANCCQVWCVYEIGIRIQYSKLYGCHKSLHLYVINYYIFSTADKHSCAIPITLFVVVLVILVLVCIVDRC